MSWECRGRSIDTIAIIGSGQIGPDIALHFAKSLAPAGVRVVVNDIAPSALEAGRARIERKIAKGIESGAFKKEQAGVILGALHFTADKDALWGAGLVVEAATEDLAIKRRIFQDLAARCSADAILASNSSHLTPEALFEDLPSPQRCLVLHYFFPAERNPLLEVVPGRRTDAAVAAFCMEFYEAIGKVPIQVGSRYGYAIDPIFEGLFLAALLLWETGVASPEQIDQVARKTLGMGVGPFTAMNLAGGIPITRIGMKGYHEAIMPWFRVTPALESRTEPWPTAPRGSQVEVDSATFEKVSRALQGAYFGLAAEVLDSGLTSVDDLDMAVELGLVMKAPVRLMNEVGVREALTLVEEYADANPGFKVAPVLRRAQPWTIRRVLRRDVNDVAIVTVRRPATLNALDRAAFFELAEVFSEIRKDPAIRAAVLTGFGVKAFVSGADIGMLAAVRSSQEGETLSWESQQAFLAVENLGKPVVCALNGLALGGGSELAMACTARIARAGQSVCFGQPEPKLGIIPGAGATQRLPRLIGLEAAAEILRTGRTVSGAEALRLGWLRKEVKGSLIDAAVALAREMAASNAPSIEKGSLRTPRELPSLDIGALSRRVDEILVKAILEGCALPLEAGLRFESKCFGEICATRDMRIGLENYLKTQLKTNASFVHA
jgi:enoyl-CoA hydratase/3-hydroxyacyl-CoA dehydrogenase